MLCEHCKSKNATVHYNYSVNGVKTDLHLCVECAEKFGLNSGNSGFENGLFSGLFGDFFGINSGVQKGIASGHSSSLKDDICPSCGMSRSELHKGGRFGCSECYNTFAQDASAMLARLHVSTEYMGKIPEGVSESLSVSRKIEKLQRDMQDAVNRQDYEEAARIRDAIKLLQNPDSSLGGAEI